MSDKSSPMKEDRSRNAKAQARHRAKRKAYVEQLETNLAGLQVAAGMTVQDLEAGHTPPIVRLRELESVNAILGEENKDLRIRLAHYEAQERTPRDSSASVYSRTESISEPPRDVPNTPNQLYHPSEPSQESRTDYRQQRPSISVCAERPYYAMAPEPQPTSAYHGQLPSMQHSAYSKQHAESMASSPLTPHSPPSSAGMPAFYATTYHHGHENQERVGQSQLHYPLAGNTAEPQSPYILTYSTPPAHAGWNSYPEDRGH